VEMREDYGYSVEITTMVWLTATGIWTTPAVYSSNTYLRLCEYPARVIIYVPLLNWLPTINPRSMALMFVDDLWPDTRLSSAARSPPCLLPANSSCASTIWSRSVGGSCLSLLNLNRVSILRFWYLQCKDITRWHTPSRSEPSRFEPHRCMLPPTVEKHMLQLASRQQQVTLRMTDP
jgi:hypothetical protein